MKISFGKNLDREKAKARARIDAHFVPLLNQQLGRKSAIYAAKHAAAIAFLGGASSPLVADEAEAQAILIKHAASFEMFALIEQERQLAQAEIDGADSAVAIEAIIARIIPPAVTRLRDSAHIV